MVLAFSGKKQGHRCRDNLRLHMALLTENVDLEDES
jgi:hypothetical protein